MSTSGSSKDKDLKYFSEDQVFKIKAIAMANARKLIKKSKFTNNANLYMNLFGTGMTTAIECCEKSLGLDPGSRETNYSEMLDFIDSH